MKKLIDLILLVSVFFLLKPFAPAFEDLAFAQEINGLSGVGNKTFTISAYYSPLPCQNRYVTGSFAGDVRLNGEGVHTADGSIVYPGLIAAPRTYAFGTKMDIPGIGIVAVHDRGGAIVSGNGLNLYDRLDVWMGYGDKGLKRALNWGKRTMDVVVYGVNDSIAEQVTLGDYSPDEGQQNECGSAAAESNENMNTGVADEIVVNDETIEIKKESTPVLVASESTGIVSTIQPQLEELLTVDLKFGDSGDKVRSLQNQLAKLNFYRTAVTGNFGEVTKHAVFKFQQSQSLVIDENSPYAGVFGPKTRDRMNELVVSNNYNQIKIARATNDFQTIYLAKIEADKPRKTLIAMELRYGMRGPEVAELQKFLKAHGFFEGALITQYYGPVTKDAVLNFQKAHKIVDSENDIGAGHVGPATLEVINTLS